MGSDEFRDFKWSEIPLKDTYENKEIEDYMKVVSNDLYCKKVLPSCSLSKVVGNTYTASVYMNLADLLSNQGADIEGKSILIFSYGSGSMASLFEINARVPSTQNLFTLEKMQNCLGINKRLMLRIESKPIILNLALSAREISNEFVPFQPKFPISHLEGGAYYLKEITHSFQRIYERKEKG